MEFAGKEDTVNSICGIEKKALKEPFFRALWRECFQDPLEYEKFYFDVVYKNNIVYEWNEKGMLHLNPYICSVNGREVLLHYIVGVATKASERRKGVMRHLLDAALADMYERKELFTYLMPADVKYYESFGFVSVSKKRETDIFSDKMNDGGLLKASSFNISDNAEIDSKVLYLSYEDFLKQFCEEEQKRLLHIVCKWLKDRYEVFTVHHKEYMDLLLKEKKCQGGDLIFCFKEKLSFNDFLGFFAYVKDEEAFVVEQTVFLDDFSETDICRDYFKNDYKKIERFSYMIRIVHVESFLGVFSECFNDFAKDGKRLILTDNFLMENNGSYIFINKNGKTVVRRQEDDGDDIMEADSKTEVRMTVEELAEYIFSKNQIFFAEVV